MLTTTMNLGRRTDRLVILLLVFAGLLAGACHRGAAGGGSAAGTAREEHYATVGDAFLWTLGAGLGDDFTEDVKTAWITAYTTLSNVMIDAAAAA
jgi:hypothetical protein